MWDIRVDADCGGRVFGNRGASESRNSRMTTPRYKESRGARPIALAHFDASLTMENMIRRGKSRRGRCRVTYTNIAHTRHIREYCTSQRRKHEPPQNLIEDGEACPYRIGRVQEMIRPDRAVRLHKCISL